MNATFAPPLHLRAPMGKSKCLIDRPPPPPPSGKKVFPYGEPFSLDCGPFLYVGAFILFMKPFSYVGARPFAPYGGLFWAYPFTINYTGAHAICILQYQINFFFCDPGGGGVVAISHPLRYSRLQGGNEVGASPRKSSKKYFFPHWGFFLHMVEAFFLLIGGP